MPELPDVEIFRRFLERHGVGKTIDRMEVRAPGLLIDTTRRKLEKRAAGRRIAATRRHGKNLFAALDEGGAILLHFGMTGELSAWGPLEEEPRWTRLLFRFTDGSRLSFVDMRKFGFFGFVDSIDGYLADRSLGPDALAIERREWLERSGRRRGAIKAALLDQSFLAGVGNLYADEILFQAKIHPARSLESLTPKVRARVFSIMKRVLQKGIDVEVDFNRLPRRWLLPNREKGHPCPRCGAALTVATIAGRTTYFCEREQR